MVSLSYDLHIHSCLSPCGDDDMTPANIVGMAVLKGLDVIAVTDHNSCKNCPYLIERGQEFGLIVIAGMEITTIEEVHAICLFERLEDAMSFDSYVYDHLIPVLNNKEIFGKQQICNQEDEIVGEISNLLINVTDIPFDSLYDLVVKYHGIMFPAHMDKNSNSLLSNLGFIGPDNKFDCIELKDIKTLHTLQNKNPYLTKCKIISNSDAHYLEHINEPIHTLYAKSKSVKDILEALHY
jgi:3',5'-nucleoside bisphosphate phosphatase